MASGFRCVMLVSLGAATALRFRPPVMQLSENFQVSSDLRERLKISGSRAVIAFIPADADSADELDGFAREALGCPVLAVRPVDGADGGSDAKFAPLAFVADEVFDRTTLRREFAVPIRQTATGAKPARVTYVLDVAGVVRGVFVDDAAQGSHAEFARATLAAMDAAPDTEAEVEFMARSVEAADGQLVVKRPSAVGRMRERMAAEQAERDADPQAALKETVSTGVFAGLLVAGALLLRGQLPQ